MIWARGGSEWDIHVTHHRHVMGAAGARRLHVHMCILYDHFMVETGRERMRQWSNSVGDHMLSSHHAAPCNVCAFGSALAEPRFLLLLT